MERLASRAGTRGNPEGRGQWNQGSALGDSLDLLLLYQLLLHIARRIMVKGKGRVH